MKKRQRMEAPWMEACVRVWRTIEKVIKKHLQLESWQTRLGKQKKKEGRVISLQFISSIKHCTNKADTRLACWSPVSPVIYSQHVRVCVCVRACECVFVWVATIYSLASGCGPGKTKHWRRSSARLTSCGPRRPQQSVITACVCVCWWTVHLLQTGGGASLLCLSRGGTLSFEVCVSLSTH